MAEDCSIVVEDAVRVIVGLALYAPVGLGMLGATNPTTRRDV